MEEAGRPGAQIQRAGMAVADAGFDAAARFKEAQRAQMLIGAQAQMTRDLADVDNEFQADTDWQTMPARYQERTRGLLDKYRENLASDPTVFSMLSRDFQRSTLRGSVEINKLARTRQVESGKADLETSLETYSQLAAKTSDPLATAEIEGRARSSIAGMVSAGLIGADDGQKRERQFYDRVAQTRAIALIRDNPDEAFRRLSDPADGGFDRMDPKTREGLLTQANNRATSLANERARAQDRAESQARAALQREGDALMKDVEARIAAGNIPNSDEMRRLERHGGISPADMRVLRRSMTEDAGTDDGNTVIDLTRRSVADNPADFEAAASRAVEAGRLKISTYRALVEKNRADNRSDAPPSPYKSGRELVSTTLDPGAIFQGSAAAIGRSAQAQAIVEFDNWARANPRANAADAVAEAQNVIKRYQIIQFQNLSLAIGVPRFVEGGRSAISLENLATAESEVIRRLDAGQLSREQADQELRKIEGWRFIKQQPAAAPASGQGRAK